MTRIDELEARIRSLGSCVVAFSGGVDSSLVAALAARALGERALAVTAVSPALATGELDGARERRRARSASGTRRSRRPSSSARATARTIATAATTARPSSTTSSRRSRRDEAIAAVLSGANADDLGDWRPGLARGGGARGRPPAARGRRRQGRGAAARARARRAERGEARVARASRRASRTAPRWIPRRSRRSIAPSSR